MLTFNYTAHKNDSGEIVKAEVQAETEQAAAKLLMKRKSGYNAAMSRLI